MPSTDNSPVVNVYLNALSKYRFSQHPGIRWDINIIELLVHPYSLVLRQEFDITCADFSVILRI